MSFEILATGPLALVQDRGRFGYAAMGVGASGAFDRLSAARANHAVGNLAEAAVLEVLAGGLEMLATFPAMVAVTGTQADVTVTNAFGQSVVHSTNSVLDLEAGDTLKLSMSTYGLRAYVSVRGGFDVPKVLGSASTDMLSGIGPAPLSPGDVLGVGTAIEDPAWWPRIRRLPTLWRPMPEETLKIIPGPRDDWFTESAMQTLLTQTYTISADSNRVGMRLVGETPLERARSGEIASEGMVRGSIQVPPNGQPMVFGPDHPVTGGYPVIAVLTARSCDRAAQLGPGDTVSFRLA